MQSIVFPRFMRCTLKPVVLIAYIMLQLLNQSCVTQRKVEYLQDYVNKTKSYDEAELAEYKLKPNDELYIQINSLDIGTANVFSMAGNQQSTLLGTITPYGASLLSYSVDKEGYMLLPIIGKILVKDKTVPEVNIMLKDSLTNILNQPIVTVKLVNRFVSVLGEVRNPGHFAISQEKLSVYDAISLAGDITDYGDRNNVILVRNENKQNTRILLDLTKPEILSSEFYNMRPNDFIYVRPLRHKFWGMREFPFSVIFSTITTGLLIYSAIK